MAIPFLYFSRIMKTIGSRSRKSAVIANSRWLAYATAGASSAFIGANSAEGAIHYSGPINQWIGEYDQVKFQLDQPGDSFLLRHYRIWTGGYGGTAWFGVAGLKGAAFAGFYHCSSGNPRAAFVSNLDQRQLISNQRFLRPHIGLVWASWARSCSYNGQFEGEQTGYIGFRFNNGNGNQYGWARIALGEYDHPVKLLDYAWGDVGDRVRAGQTSSNEIATDKGSLGLLALGAIGLVAWRKRRSEQQRAQL